MNFITDNEYVKSNWQWLLIIALLVLSFIVLPVVRKVLKHIRETINQRNRNSYVLALLSLPLEKPITGLILTIVWHWGLLSLHLSESTNKPIAIAMTILRAFYVIQLAYMASEAVGEWLRKLASQTETNLDDQLVPMARRALKILVITLGILITLQNIGLNVVSLLAGLGLGGLALALAAQDTAANVFGSITILADRPFQVGHYIKLGGLEGTVEDIGFRSTRIRTLTNTLVTVPNATVAKEQIENFAHKTSSRFRHVLGITYDTSVDRMEAFMEAIRSYLKGRDGVLPNDLRVRFESMGDFSLNIGVQCYLNTTSVEIQNQWQEEILFEIMRIAQNLDVQFAFPTRTLEVSKWPEAPLPKA